MRKFLFVASMLFVGMGSMQAQVAYEKAKFFDNFYVGVEGGVATNMSFNRAFPLNPVAGVKVGKNFSPVFGANVEGLVTFGDNNFANSHTIVKGLNVGLNGTVNFTNLFCDYNAQRTFEVILEAGVGYGKVLGDKVRHLHADNDELTSKTGLVFALNLGQAKAWQLYVEPAVLWNLTNQNTDAVRFNNKHAQVGLMAGLNYKFGTSNGTHNFKAYNVGEMNDEINDLRAQLAAKPKEVVREVVKEVVKEVPTQTVQHISVDNLVFVTFAQGKSALTAAAKKALDDVKSGSHVEIVGTASPEGSKELNDRLSQSRADAVAAYLKDKGVVVDQATGKGVQGVTSNRLAVVYVK